MEGIQNNTINNKCSKCGDCCGLFIPFTKQELQIIKEYVSKHFILPYNRLDKTTNTFKAHCCFYNEKDKKCMIYDVRPWVCKDFLCNNKDWIQRRNRYEQYGDYNGMNSNNCILATFDDLIYDNYEPILYHITNQMSTRDTNEFIQLLASVKRLDILDHISVVNDNGETVLGKDLLNNKKIKL